MSAANLPALLQRFFTDRLHSQLSASPHTVASYRDTFRLLLVFASERLRRAPSKLRVEEIDAAFIGAFLDGRWIRKDASLDDRDRQEASHSRSDVLP